jgi:two-component system NarL family response regulator
MILTSFLKEADVRRAFEVGILAYVSKDADSEELLTAVREVAAGHMFVPPAVSGLLAKSTASARLSERELEILRLIAKGLANKEIGTRLSVAENTVKNHIKSILAKLDARDRTHAVSEGLQRGLFRLDDG